MLLAQDIRPLPRSPQQRVVIITAVAVLHVAVITAILVSLNRPAPPEIKDLTITRFTPPKATETQPPPPPPTLTKPKVDIPPPVIEVTRDGPQTTIARTDPAPTPALVDPPIRVLAARGIMGTHTTPDYPPIDARLGHEGNVLLKLTIDEWGAVVDAQVERSSGYESLDRAAASWVKSHWLYHPATRAGDPIRSTTEALVTFRLTGR